MAPRRRGGDALSSFPLDRPFPWPQSHHDDLLTNDSGDRISVNLLIRMEKGFEFVDNIWTCYRRNYFELSAGYTLSHPSLNQRLYYDGQQVQGMAIWLVAIGEDGLVAEHMGDKLGLKTYTTKREAATAKKVRRAKIAPGLPLSSNICSMTDDLDIEALMPVLSHQWDEEIYDSDPEDDEEELEKTARRLERKFVPLVETHGETRNKQHTFERCQFIGATANNGQRRRNQHHFRLKMLVQVDLRDPGADEPEWMTIAWKMSGQLVVRGRSPHHYEKKRASRSTDDDPPPARDPGPLTSYQFAAEPSAQTGRPSRNRRRHRPRRDGQQEATRTADVTSVPSIKNQSPDLFTPMNCSPHSYVTAITSDAPSGASISPAHHHGYSYASLDALHHHDVKQEADGDLDAGGLEGNDHNHAFSSFTGSESTIGHVSASAPMSLPEMTSFRPLLGASSYLTNVHSSTEHHHGTGPATFRPLSPPRYLHPGNLSHVGMSFSSEATTSAGQDSAAHNPDWFNDLRRPFPANNFGRINNGGEGSGGAGAGDAAGLRFDYSSAPAQQQAGMSLPQQHHSFADFVHGIDFGTHS